ncbi:deoxyribonucleoside kinase [Carabus blaptoides fortunei]
MVNQSIGGLTRVQVQTTPPKNASTAVQIFERSVQNNRFCFVEQAYLAGYLQSADYEVLHQWYQWMELNIDIEIDFIVYLQTSPELVYERMRNRGRKEEEMVPLQYLKELHDSHETWLLGNNTAINKDCLLVINANKPLDEVLNECDLNKNIIFRKVSI